MSATIEIDDKWAKHHSIEDTIDYLEERLNSALGFRGTIKRIRLET